MEDFQYIIPRSFFREMVDLVERYQLLLESTKENDKFFEEMRRASIVECEIALRKAEEIEYEQ